MTGGIIPLYGYEQRFIDDHSRLKGWLKGRQIGGSFTATLEIALDMVQTGEDWNTMSRSQRQARKLLLKLRNHLLAINRFVVTKLGNDPIIREADIGSERLRLLNGAVAEALPCDPDTTAGDTINWLIDEFALFPKSHEVFGIIKPSIMHGKKMRVIATPRGPLNKFADLYRMFEEQGQTCGWSWHRTTIEDAVADGLVLRDPEGGVVAFDQWRKQEIRDIGDEMYGQEYMCAFSDKLTIFLPFAVIQRSQNPNLQMARSIESLVGCGRDLYVGMDIGRRRNWTVIWVVSRSGDAFVTEAVFILVETPFEEQERVLGSVLRTHCVGGCAIDAQGNGMELAEKMAKEFPGIVHGVNFTNPLKAEMAGRLRVAMETGNFFMPDDADVAADFASIQRNITAAGNVQIAAPQSGSGHGDCFWAAGLALHVAACYPKFELIMAG